jgi:TonB-linked outer membrane protein, SusC/RagA family/TonB-dependent outer membrane receptor, SusC/RagA subfamily, signature region
MLILCSFSVFGQNTIRGTVVDNVGQPIIGATVLVKSTNNGVVTNTQGEFSFTADTPLPITLSVSLIGYRTQEIDVYDAEEPITVLLLEELNYLKEVVVVGYDTQTRKEFTGSAARITSDAIRDVPVQSFEQALSGVAAGVNISVPNGILNNPPLIRIRGVNSISLSSYPLIIVDGIPVSTGDISTNTNIANNPLGDINPSDIESVDVLKDAASTSIYGSRAAAGVIIITTKRGKTGKAKTTYEGWVGVTNATRLPELLNAQQYIDIKNEAVLNSKILTGNANNDNVSAALYFPSYNNDGSLVDTRWYDHVYRTAVSHNHALTISGGNASTNYYFSANYTDQEGFLIGNDFERKGVRLNIDQKVTDWFKLKGTASYNTSLNKSYSSGSLAGSSQFLTAAARLAISLPPNVAPYNHSDGSYNLSPTGTLGAGSNLVASTLYNPVALFDYTSISSSNDRFLGSLNANLKILNRFDYNITYALDRLKGENVSYLSPLLGSSGYGVGGSATNISVLLNNTAFTNTLAYSNKINKNNLSVLIGTDLQQFVTDIWGVYATKSTDEFFKYYQGGWANITSSGNKRGERVYLSYFSRINYNFDDKYFFTGNFRRDGNSALAEGNKYGNFGGVSAGWALSQEDFL